MKQYLFYIVKYFKWVYTLYFYMGTFLLGILKLFVKSDDRLILFISFGGRKFDDSPKSIFDEMIKDNRFDGYKLVWAFTEPQKHIIPQGEKIKVDTLKYFITALKARVWITNSEVERGLAFKDKHTLYFNTWHGTPLKKMGSDISSNSKTFRAKAPSHYNIFLAQGEYEADIFSRAFNVEKEKIKVVGLPRNDIYASCSEDYIASLKLCLSIPQGKKIILYAPTFREYESNSIGQRILSIPIDLEEWQKQLSDEWVVLFRAHYEVAKAMNIQSNDFVREMSSYPSLEDLMLVADVLISDYSSIFFDYSIMHKPMLCFAYDFDQYSSQRGMYFDIREHIITVTNESDLLCAIKQIDIPRESEQAHMFQKRFVTAYGNASKESLNLIYDVLQF